MLEFALSKLKIYQPSDILMHTCDHIRTSLALPDPLRTDTYQLEIISAS